MSVSNITSNEDEDKTDNEAGGGEDSKKGSDKDENEENLDEEEEFSYRVYFRKEEIKMAREMQARDQFEDVIAMRMNAAYDA